MPEGPEIRFSKEWIKKFVLNKTVDKIKALSKTKVHIPTKSKIIKLGTKGKLLWIQTNSYFIHIHFGMTGWMYTSNNQIPKNVKYIINFTDNTAIYIDSTRKFTKLTICNKKEHDNKINNLGIDILTKNFTFFKFSHLITSRNIMITKFLLDQDKICGVGNYLKSDSLYLAKIHPNAKTGNLTDVQILNLFNAIKYTSVSSLLTWLKSNKLKVPMDIQKIKPTQTTFNYNSLVYDKQKDKYGNKVTNEIIGGRRTYYVKKIQKL